MRFRDDEETARAIRRAWPEMDVTRHGTRWAAYRWDGTSGEPLVTARTSRELGVAIQAAWVATGNRRPVWERPR